MFQCLYFIITAALCVLINGWMVSDKYMMYKVSYNDQAYVSSCFYCCIRLNWKDCYTIVIVKFLEFLMNTSLASLCPNPAIVTFVKFVVSQRLGDVRWRSSLI